MISLVRLIFILIVCVNTRNTFAQYVGFRNYLNEEGSSSPTVYHVLADSKGFIWFGTEYGVIRFDGKNYLKLTINNGLSDNEVLKIQEDSKGRIWFLTLNGRFSYYYNGKIFNEANNAVLKAIGPFATLNSFYEDRLGNLWFTGHFNQILKVTPTNQVQKFDFGNQKVIPQIGRGTFFYEDKRGNLLLIGEKNFYRFNSTYNIKPVLYKYKINGLKTYFSDKNHNLLFLAKEGLVEMQDTVQRLIIPSSKLPVPDQIESIFVDKSQNLWFNTLGNGVYQIKNYKNNPAPYRHFLPGEIITWITQDQEKNIWFTSAGQGVYMLPGNFFNFNATSYTTEEGLASNNVYSLTKDKNNHLWVGLDNGQVNQITPTGIKVYQVNYSKSKYNRVLDIFADKNNTIWCATDAGVVKLKPDKAGKYRPYRLLYHNDARSYAAKSMAQAPDNKITFAHSGGIEVFKNYINPKNPYRIAPLPGVTSSRTYTHFYDHSGTLWYSNLNGLQKHVNSGSSINYGATNFLLSRRITAIAELPDTSLVLTTFGYGVIIFKNGQVIRHISKKNGLAEDICKKVFVQGPTVWVATTAGLSKITLKNKAKTEIRNYYNTDGLLSNDINAVYADAQDVYIATPKGLSILKPNHRQVVSKPPPVYLTQVTAGKRLITNQPGIKLDYQQNRFTFNFIGITYQNPANVEYVYRLHAVNSNWIATTNNSVEFSALAPGKYVFEIKAKKQNSTWSQPVRYSFSINSPFWQTWWFLTFAVLLTVGTVYFISWYFLQQKLKVKIKQLETEHKIQLERERIARDLHDNVGSHLTYIVNRLDDSPYFSQEPEQHNQMEQLRAYTRQTIAQLRETIWAIRKEHISVGELSEKLQKLLWQLVPPQGPLKYHFKTQANEAILLTPVQTLNIFRIAQEAITNVIKHSQASFLTVQLTTVADKYLQLLLLDNGIGFEPADINAAENYGLTNMHARAAELKTTLELKSDKGQGTQITLLINLNNVAAPSSVPPNKNASAVYTNNATRLR